VVVVILCVVAPVDQVYVPPPALGVAVKVVVAPEQIVSLFTATVGAGVTVTVPVPVPGVQPDPKEYVTIYVPAVVAVMDEVVAPVDHA
jgi:hypothetical protein